MKEVTNKYGVPHIDYIIYLADGGIRSIDIGVEEDWGSIQPMDPADFPDAQPDYFYDVPGFGNDIDGHVEIVAVKEVASQKFVSVRSWAGYVWSFEKNYST